VSILLPAYLALDINASLSTGLTENKSITLTFNPSAAIFSAALIDSAKVTPQATIKTLSVSDYLNTFAFPISNFSSFGYKTLFGILLVLI
jgi:hypothetical protein